MASIDDLIKQATGGGNAKPNLMGTKPLAQPTVSELERQYPTVAGGLHGFERVGIQAGGCAFQQNLSFFAL